MPENVVHYSIAVNATLRGAVFGSSANLSLYNSSDVQQGELLNGTYSTDWLGDSDTHTSTIERDGSPDGFYLYNSSDDSHALNSITIVYTIQVNTYYEYFQL